MLVREVDEEIGERKFVAAAPAGDLMWATFFGPDLSLFPSMSAFFSFILQDQSR